MVASGAMVPQQRVVVGPLLFTSDFDSGNMGKVERVPLSASARGAETNSCEWEYAVTVVPDCYGTPYQNSNRTWFYFGVAVAEPGDSSKAAPSAAAAVRPLAAHEGLSMSSSMLPLSSPTARGGDDLDGDAASASAEGDGENDIMSPVETLGELLDSPRVVPPAQAVTSACTESQASVEDSSGSLEDTILIQLSVRNMNNQGKLYKEGCRPWFKRLPDHPHWKRIVDSSDVKFSHEWGGEPDQGGSGFALRWRHRLRRGATSYFAFCAPYGYAETQHLVSRIENMFATQDACPNLECLSEAIQEGWVPKAGEGIYFHRQELIRSLEGRAVDLLTISAVDETLRGRNRAKSGKCVQAQEEQESMECDEVPPELQEMAGSPPRYFKDRPIAFISARVHPGETPAQFTFFGVLRFLLSDDLRARELRNNFTFKLIPILNPDGVARGHYRTNCRGLNLNRFYDHATHQEHEGIWAAKCLGRHWARQERLLLYVDLHAHATKRGCFFLANRLAGAGQAWNSGFARLMQVNSPHFDLEASDFAEPAASKKHNKDGSGRVSMFSDCKLCHSYTLECNYNSGRLSKPVVAAPGIPPEMESPGTKVWTHDTVLYTPSSWAQVGEAVCVSFLDLYGHNCCSRLKSSRYGSVARLLSSCPSLRTRPGVKGGSDIMPVFGNGVSLKAVSNRERCCDSPSCCWHTSAHSTSKALSARRRGTSTPATAASLAATLPGALPSGLANASAGSAATAGLSATLPTASASKSAANGRRSPVAADVAAASGTASASARDVMAAAAAVVASASASARLSAAGSASPSRAAHGTDRKSRRASASSSARQSGGGTVLQPKLFNKDIVVLPSRPSSVVAVRSTSQASNRVPTIDHFPVPSNESDPLLRRSAEIAMAAYSSTPRANSSSVRGGR